MKKKGCLLLLAAVVFLFSSCGAQTRIAAQDSTAAENEATSEIAENEVTTVVAENGDLLETRSFGTYTVPAGWSAPEEYSTDTLWYYIKDGVDYSDDTSYIAVEYGTNNYKASEHARFKDDILQQLLQKTQEIGAELQGQGIYTEQGYNVYVFSISAEGYPAEMQYYIVGENQYVLVAASDYMDERIPDVNDVAKKIVDSFVWA